MTRQQFLDSLVCPKTGQNLEVAENGLSLTAPDGTVYPVLDSGIVDMVHPRELFEDDAREQYLYDQAYQRYDRGVSWVFETLNHSDEAATRQFMIGLMDLKPGQTVLEVGAGTGKDSALIIDQISPGGTAVLSDLPHNMLKLATQKLQPKEVNTHFFLGNGSYLPFADGTFDAVFHFGGINTFSERKKAFAELTRVVKVGGKVVIGDESMAPCARHPFGTDNLGRDLLVRVMIGTRISLVIGVVSALIVLVIGSLYGAISGLLGGWADNVMMRIVDIINSVPTVLMVIAIKMVIEDPLEKLINSSDAFSFFQKMGSGIIAIFLVYGLLYWVGMARIVRGQVLALKEMEYINAATALGSNKTRLILKHLLPNCIGQLIVTTMLQIPNAIFTEAFLSFIGVGVSVPMASLGSLCSGALNGVISYSYRLIFPASVISIIILAFNLFGDGLRDALDPRLKK